MVELKFGLRSFEPITHMLTDSFIFKLPFQCKPSVLSIYVDGTVKKTLFSESLHVFV